MYQQRSIRQVSCNNDGNQPMFLRQLSAVGSSFLPRPQSQPVLVRAAGYRSATSPSSSCQHPLLPVPPSHPPWWSAQGYSRPWPPPPLLPPSHRGPGHSHPVRTPPPYPQLRARDPNVARATLQAVYTRGVPPPWFANPLAGTVPRSGLHTSSGLMDGGERSREPPYKRRRSTEDEKQSGAASAERGAGTTRVAVQDRCQRQVRSDPGVTGGPRCWKEDSGPNKRDQDWETVGRRKNSTRRDKEDCRDKDRDRARDGDKNSKQHSRQKDKAAGFVQKDAKYNKSPHPTGQGAFCQGSRWDSQKPKAPRTHSSEKKPHHAGTGPVPSGHKPNPWFKGGAKGVAAGRGINVSDGYGRGGGPWRQPPPQACGPTHSHPNPWFRVPSALQRHWEVLPASQRPPGATPPFEFSVLSYNILSQDLLRDNVYLYSHCHPMVLPWEYRLPNLLTEIRRYDADILCLQEVQEDHYEEQIKPALHQMGYQCEYKKRTGDKPDGCAVIFKASRLSLLSAHPVEYLRPGISVLDRDNVGLVVLLQPNPGPAGGVQIRDPSDFICVANTHLLYNPRRGDVKLAQLAVLLAEISRLSRLPDGSTNPVVMCGDFNSTPWSPLYSLLTTGFLEYQGMPIGMVSGQEISPRQQRPLTIPLWPKSLGINTHCQYDTGQQQSQSDTTQQQSQPHTTQQQSQSDTTQQQSQSDTTQQQSQPHTTQQQSQSGTTTQQQSQSNTTRQQSQSGTTTQQQSQSNTTQQHNSTSTTPGNNTGVEGAISNLTILDLIANALHNRPRLDHNVKLQSSYQHILAHEKAFEVTTCHSKTAMTVDYILYTPAPKDPSPAADSPLPGGRGLELLGTLSLVGEAELDAVNRLPNQHHSSDHLPLLARFRF